MSTFKKLGLIAGSLVLVFSLLLLVNGSLALAEEDNFENLNTLDVKVEGIYEEEDAEFRYRFKNIGTDKEVFRLDVTTLETEQHMAIILDQENEKVYIKQMGAGSWQQLPSMTLSKWWEEHREDVIVSYNSAEKWRSWADADKEEFILEGEEDGEEYTVKVYDIKVDEEIKDSVFNLDGS